MSHGHCDEVLKLLRDLALWAVDDVAKVIVTLNVTEEPLFEAIYSTAWFFEVQVIRNVTPLGFGSNHNQAFLHCDSPYFCVVNPDIRLLDNPYPSLLAALEAPFAGCAYPLQASRFGNPTDLARETPTPIALLCRYLAPQHNNRRNSREWINGSFMLFPALVFDELKGFDPRFFMYCEDVDICLRLRGIGFRLVLSESTCVEHVGQFASRRKLRHMSWHLVSLCKLWFLKISGAYRFGK